MIRKPTRSLLEALTPHLMPCPIRHISLICRFPFADPHSPHFNRLFPVKFNHGLSYVTVIHSGVGLVGWVVGSLNRNSDNMSILDLSTIPVLTEFERLEEGRDPIKVGAPHDDSSVEVAVVVVDREKGVLLTNSGDASEPVWYVASGEVNPGEDIVTAARRHLAQESALELVNARLVSIENFPSLSRNYVRYVVIGDITGDDSHTDPSRDLRWKWFDYSALKSGEIELLSNDITNTISPIVSDLSPSFSFQPNIAPVVLEHLFVQVGLVADDKLFVVRSSEDSPWRLPVTFPDYRAGETIGFASQRLFARWFKVLPDIIGAVAVEHGSNGVPRDDPLGLGSRITILARPRDLEKLQETISVAPNSRLRQWISIQEARDLSSEESSLQIVHRLIGARTISIFST
uniref:Nudix hydrolase domain-containing protein n=1 Tax=Spongospora subterranea TaxID=70186 RepID=A0A0H5QFP7_9EUKA|eukprot:CRZ00868.1 hypothetical protein [Spongospora subterranea]